MAGCKRARCSDEPSTKSAKRQVTKATFEKWQREHERDHQTLSWLRCELERDRRHVVSLYCTVCKRYESSMESLKNFSRAWITGSTNQKVSNVLDHATSEVHKVAMARMRADAAKAHGESAILTTAIGRSMCGMDSQTQARVIRKFELSYVMAKESIPFAKYPALLQLEQHHGVDIGHAYNTPESAKAFTGFIAKSQCQGFLNILSSNNHFYSLLMDGTTDAGNVEEELVALVFCTKDASTQQLITCSRFLSLYSPKKADASGLLQCIGGGSGASWS